MAVLQLVWANSHLILRGLWVTLELSAVVILAGSVLGLIGGYLILFGWRPLRVLMRLYVDLLRGLPLLVTIFAIFYGMPATGFMVSRFAAAAVALSAFAAAHMTEVIRGAVGSIEQGQWMAARSIGMTFFPSLRYVILPQALRRIVPPWVNTCVELVKATSLVSLVSVVDLLLAAQQILERTQEPLLFYGVAAVLYFLINFTISRFGVVVEQRLAYYD